MEEVHKPLDLKGLMYALLIVIGTILWTIHRYYTSTRLYILGNKLPGPYALPILGNALLAIGWSSNELAQIGIRYKKVYGDVVRAWLGYRLYVALSDPVDVEVVLDSQVHIDKADEYRYFEPWLGDGLLISTGEKWRAHRKMIAPTFHVNILKSFIGVFNQNCKAVVKSLKVEVGKSFDVHDYMGDVTVNILLETAMGVKNKVNNGTGFEYASAVIDMCDILHKRHLKFYMRSDVIFSMTSFMKKQKKLLNIIHSITETVIKSKKEAYLKNRAIGIVPPSIEELTRNRTNDHNHEDCDIAQIEDRNENKQHKDDLDFNDENDVGEKKRAAFLDLLIESSQDGTNKLTDNEIKEEFNTIMFEGHDTTAAGASFVLSLLGIHQNYQDNVYDELFGIFGESDRDVTYNDVMQMKWLERVIMETLRLYPPVPLIARKIKQDLRISTNNYTLPSGTTVIIPMYAIHRNPKYFKEPDVFNPDNFLPDNTQTRHYFSYIPFSAGPRSCVGRKYALLKLKVLLSTILRNYRVISDVTEEDFKLQADIILKRSDGFKLRIEPRSKNKC